MLIGHSRKSMFDHLFNMPLNERDTLTAVVSALCCLQGVSVLRVHSVKDNVRAVKMATLMSGNN
jgi:dihydropteroate synthase